MNLFATISLYGGGPGSGCHGENCGRPTSAIPKEVHEYIASYKPVFDKAAAMFKRTVGEYGPLEGRIKTPESMHTKMLQKGKRLEDVSDVVGLRVTTRNIEGAYKAVKDLQRVFCKGQPECKEEDLMRNPKGYYRGFHIDAFVDGKKIELQVRTENQSRLAIWGHDVAYKGALKDNPVVQRYMKKVSDAVFRMDKRLKVQLPPCPEVVAKKVGCFSYQLPYTEGSLQARRTAWQWN